MATDKRTKYRAKMDERGLVQANEWVPRDRRKLFKAVAQALRDGIPITIGEVPRDPSPEVPRDPKPEVPRDRKRRPTLGDEFARAERKIRVSYNGASYTAAVITENRGRRKFMHESSCDSVQWELIVERPGRFMRLTIIEYDGFWSLSTPQHWCLEDPTFAQWQHRGHAGTRFATVADCDKEIAEARKSMKDNHGDYGGADTAAFMAAKARLDNARRERERIAKREQAGRS